MTNKLYIRDGRAPIPEKEVTSRIMSSIKGKNTNPELIFRKTLWKLKIRGYRLNYNKLPGKPDIVFSSKKIAIFINGCFWHRCSYCQPSFPKSNKEFWKTKFDKNIERDLRKSNLLKELGWTVYTIWECEIKTSEKKRIEIIKKLFNDKNN